MIGVRQRAGSTWFLLGDRREQSADRDAVLSGSESSEPDSSHTCPAPLSSLSRRSKGSLRAPLCGSPIGLSRDKWLKLA